MWFKKNIWAIIGNILIWGTPLMILGFYMLTGDETVSRHWQGWVSIALFVVALVYYKVLKQRLSESRLADKIRKGYVSVIWRVMEVIIYACVMVGIAMSLWLLYDIGVGLLDYVIVVGAFGLVGKVMLIIDSAKKANEAEITETPPTNP